VHVTGRSAAIAALGPEVRLVTLGPVTEAPGVEVRTRPIPASLPAAVRAARGFLHDVRSFAPDLLHLHYAGGKLGTMALLSGVRPLVVTVMGGDVLAEQHPGGLPARERRATRRILEAADLVLVKSEALRPVVAEMGRLRARVETVRWGVDPAVFRRDPEAAGRLRRGLGLADSDRVVLSPRLLAPLYNGELIVEAMAEVVRQVPAAVLLLTEYGADAAYRDRLARRAEALGLAGRIRWLGAVAHRDMPALYSLAEAIVSVPSSDGLPQSLFEAMACGTPAVLGRLRAYEEVVRDGDTALLADLSADAIARALLRLLAEPGLHASIARAAQARVAEVALLPAEAGRVVRLYAEVLASPRPPRAGVWRDGRILDALGLLLR
jgi:glycosyltransferase involved in cell wall biosynthesis